MLYKRKAVFRLHRTAVSTDMEEDALAPFGIVEVLDKFHVATVTTLIWNRELVYKVIIEQKGMILIIMST